MAAPVTVSWSPEATFVVDPEEEEDPMNPLLTRRQLVQRGAAGITLLSLPGLLAACGGDDGAARPRR